MVGWVGYYVSTELERLPDKIIRSTCRKQAVPCVCLTLALARELRSSAQTATTTTTSMLARNLLRPRTITWGKHPSSTHFPSSSFLRGEHTGEHTNISG